MGLRGLVLPGVGSPELNLPCLAEIYVSSDPAGEVPAAGGLNS